MDVVIAACLLALALGKARRDRLARRRERLLQQLDWVRELEDLDAILED